MISAFTRAVAQLGDSALRRVVWLGLLGAGLVFALLWLGVGLLLTHTRLFASGWLDVIVDVAGGAATLVGTFLLFPAVVTAVLGFFLEDAADVVERRHYPLIGGPRRQSVEEIILNSLKFLAAMVALNLFALLFLLVPPVFPFVFYAVNGYLLGREYFEVVAIRRHEPSVVAALRRRYRGPLFLAGVIIAFLLTLPLVNLVAPVIGVAAMVHLYHQLKMSPAIGGTVRR